VKISLYIRKDLRQYIERMVKYSGSTTNAIRDMIRACAYLMEHGLKPEHIILISRFLDSPSDNVEKEFRSGMDKTFERILGKISAILDSFLVNASITAEYLIGKYFNNAAEIVSKYRKIGLTRKRKERTNISKTLSEIEEIGD